LSEIDKVKVTFKDEELSIQKLQEEINTNEEQRKNNLEHIQQKQTALETSIKEAEETNNKRKEILEQITEVSKNSTQKAEEMKQRASSKEELRKRCLDEYDEWHRLRRKVQDLTDKQVRYAEKASKHELLINDVNIQVNNTKSALAKMEEEKKAFAAARKFKDAGRIANEIKSVYGTLEKLQKTLEDYKKEKENWNKEIEEIIKDIDKYKDEQNKAEEQLNKSKYKQVTLKLSELDMLLKITEEIKATQENLNVIKEQIEIYTDEANSMKAKYRYLNECNYESLSEEKIRQKLSELKSQVGTLESEIEELSKKEEYEAAEEKQGEINRLTESIKNLEEIIKKKFGIAQPTNNEVVDNKSTSNKEEISNEPENTPTESKEEAQ
jgi:chromosome segregation ATPase